MFAKKILSRWTTSTGQDEEEQAGEEQHNDGSEFEDEETCNEEEEEKNDDGSEEVQNSEIEEVLFEVENSDDDSSQPCSRPPRPPSSRDSPYPSQEPNKNKVNEEDSLEKNSANNSFLLSVFSIPSVWNLYPYTFKCQLRTERFGESVLSARRSASLVIFLLSQICPLAEKKKNISASPSDEISSSCEFTRLDEEKKDIALLAAFAKILLPHDTPCERIMQRQKFERWLVEHPHPTQRFLPDRVKIPCGLNVTESVGVGGGKNKERKQKELASKPRRNKKSDGSQTATKKRTKEQNRDFLLCLVCRELYVQVAGDLCHSCQSKREGKKRRWEEEQARKKEKRDKQCARLVEETVEKIAQTSSAGEEDARIDVHDNAPGSGSEKDAESEKERNWEEEEDTNKSEEDDWQPVKQNDEDVEEISYEPFMAWERSKKDLYTWVCGDKEGFDIEFDPEPFMTAEDGTEREEYEARRLAERSVLWKGPGRTRHCSILSDEDLRSEYCSGRISLSKILAASPFTKASLERQAKEKGRELRHGDEVEIGSEHYRNCSTYIAYGPSWDMALVGTGLEYGYAQPIETWDRPNYSWRHSEKKKDGGCEKKSELLKKIREDRARCGGIMNELQEWINRPNRFQYDLRPANIEFVNHAKNGVALISRPSQWNSGREVTDEANVVEPEDPCDWEARHEVDMLTRETRNPQIVQYQRELALMVAALQEQEDEDKKHFSNGAKKKNPKQKKK